jgi:sugar/nucleoside kinase (ribokinase family)
MVERTGAGDGFMAAMISRPLPELKHIDKVAVQATLDFANVLVA